MSRQFTRDYQTEVNLGNIPGRAMVVIIGHDSTVPSGGPFTLSPGFGGASYTIDQSAIAATPAVVGVASTDNVGDIAAGTGALTVKIKGLDASGDAQEEDVTLTGTTAALTVATFSAVFSVEVLTTGANNSNDGTIWVGTGTFTAGVPAVRMLSAEIGTNVSLSAYYVVPTGKTLVIKDFGMVVASTTKDAEVIMSISGDGILWKDVFPLGSGAGSFTAPMSAVPGVVAGTHIKLSAVGTAASTDITSFLMCELADN
jgi:hypothetical protein